MTAISEGGRGKNHVKNHGESTGTKPCRLWKGALNSDGYPVFRFKGRLELVTRLVLSFALGRPIRRGFEAAHTCHVRHCIEETHLVEATHRENCNMRRAG